MALTRENITKRIGVRAIQINGFADLHTHILPGIDDGAPDLETAREMVRIAWENGTRILFLTPHYRGVYKKNTPAFLREKFEKFRQIIAQEYPEMKLYLGQEVHHQTEVPERLSQGQILTLCDSDYVLLEFRSGSLRSQILSAVTEMVRYGYTPIIAHAERYEAFRTDPSLADEVLDLGALIQLNADSVMGKHGFRVKHFCHKMLKTQSAQFIGSDAHETGRRTPILRACFWYVKQRYGSEYAARVFYHNALAIIENKGI